MLGAFASSWELFHNAYLVGWLVAALLGLVGVVVVARDQIFLGAAVSQASTLGIALALWLGGAVGSEHGALLASNGFKSALAVAFSIAAALLAGRRREEHGESHEAVTGWVFLLSSSLAVLLLSHSPHGLEEIHRLVASSILGAAPADVAVFGALSVVVVAVVARTQRTLLLFVLDRPMAEAVGVRVGAWSVGLAVATGLTIGLAIRASGLLYTFSCLVIPALVAKNLCREVRPMFVVAPIVGVAAGVAGFVLANYHDYPPAQMATAVQCGLLALAWAWRRVRAWSEESTGSAAGRAAPARSTNR